MTKTLSRLTRWEVSATLRWRWLTLCICLGTEAILANLEVNIDQGISEAEKEDREIAFGTNYREPAKANSWFSFLLQQLGDTMLIILICAAIVSLLLSYLTVPPEDYGHGKSHQPCAACAAPPILTS